MSETTPPQDTPPIKGILPPDYLTTTPSTSRPLRTRIKVHVPKLTMASLLARAKTPADLCFFIHTLQCYIEQIRCIPCDERLIPELESGLEMAKQKLASATEGKVCFIR